MVAARPPPIQHSEQHPVHDTLINREIQQKLDTLRISKGESSEDSRAQRREMPWKLAPQGRSQVILPTAMPPTEKIVLSAIRGDGEGDAGWLVSPSPLQGCSTRHPSQEGRCTSAHRHRRPHPHRCLSAGQTARHPAQPLPRHAADAPAAAAVSPPEVLLLRWELNGSPHLASPLTIPILFGWEMGRCHA